MSSTRGSNQKRRGVPYESTPYDAQTERRHLLLQYFVSRTIFVRRVPQERWANPQHLPARALAECGQLCDRWSQGRLRCGTTSHRTNALVLTKIRFCLTFILRTCFTRSRKSDPYGGGRPPARWLARSAGAGGRLTRIITIGIISPYKSDNAYCIDIFVRERSSLLLYASYYCPPKAPTSSFLFTYIFYTGVGRGGCARGGAHGPAWRPHTSVVSAPLRLTGSARSVE